MFYKVKVNRGDLLNINNSQSLYCKIERACRQAIIKKKNHNNIDFLFITYFINSYY